MPENINIVVEDQGVISEVVDPSTGLLQITNDDGSVDIEVVRSDVNPDIDGKKHEANLALKLSDGELNGIAEELLEGIQADDESRSDWLNQRSKGIDMLGLKVEPPKSGVGRTSAPLEGMSNYRDPVLTEAVVRFQANCQGEMLPASGPVKVVDYGDQTAITDRLAERLEKDLNFYLTTTATEYYPDTRQMFFWTGFSGLAFKKVYRCPIRRRPVSEAVDAVDLIVSNAITDLRNAGRVTHQISMRPSVMKRMQILGVYRDVSLTTPQPEPNAVKLKVAQVEGIQLQLDRPQDQPYTVYECYCELDLPGFEHKEKGKATGLPLPYRVTIDKDSRQILEIRRNWDKDDPDYLAEIPFVAFPYVTGLGFYGLGLLQLMGSSTQALTALSREAIDAGMFANFPGLVYSKADARQMTNEFRIPPGGAQALETGGKSIRDVLMALPYHEAGPGHMALIQQLRGVAQRMGSTAETPVGEGKQDAPVGTTLALIEQATKVQGGVHKALHAAQAEEFQLLVKLFREDPEALWRGNKRPALGRNIEEFKAALDRCDIVPKSDPNVPSHMHRVMKAQALKALSANNPLYNPMAVEERVLAMLDIDRPQDLLQVPTPAGPPPVDQVKVAELAIKAKAEENKQMKMAFDAVEKAKDRESRQNIEVLKLASSLAVHPESDPIVDEQIRQLAPMMTNIKPKPPPGPVPIPMGLGGLGRPLSFAPPPPRRPAPMAQGFSP